MAPFAQSSQSQLPPSQSNQYFRSWAIEAIVFALIVGLGVASRFFLADVPNFKPVAAIAIFGGFFFTRPWLAVLATIGVLLISDFSIGTYDWPVAASVYGSLIAGCLLGRLIAGQFGRGLQSKVFSTQRWFSGPISVAGAAILMSCLFFVVTNFAVWANGVWYPLTWQGLVSCYVNAVPFFKYTLLGDCLFTLTAFVAYYFASSFQQTQGVNIDRGQLGRDTA